MRFNVVSLDLKGITTVQDLKTLICIQLHIFECQCHKCVAHDTETANQVNHFQNFFAKVWKIM